MSRLSYLNDSVCDYKKAKPSVSFVSFLLLHVGSSSLSSQIRSCHIPYHCINFTCVCAVLLKVYCSDHTYTTIRIPVAATGREVISAVTDKLGTTDELLLVHLSSAGGKKTDHLKRGEALTCSIIYS